MRRQATRRQTNPDRKTKPANPAPAVDGGSVGAGRASLALGLGTLVSHGFGISLVPALLPHIESDFASGYAVLGAAVATGLGAYAIGAVAAAPILRRVGSRLVLIATFLVAALGFFVSAAAFSPLYVALATAILGIAAPVSWAASLHVAREAVDPGSLSTVSSAASGGAAVGVIANGTLVWLAGSLISWRVAFVFAGLVAVLAVVVASRVFAGPIARMPHSDEGLLQLYAKTLADQSARMIVFTSAAAGAAIFTLVTFLTATAIDEMGSSSSVAGLLLILGGTVGTAAAVFFGRLGDRLTPAVTIAIVYAVYTAGAAVLFVAWSLPGLIVAVVGYGVLNGPVWGLMGAAANRRFSAEKATAAIALSLVAASIGGAVGNLAAGWWLDSSGSMRGPVAGLVIISAVTTIYLYRQPRFVPDPAS